MSKSGQGSVENPVTEAGVPSDGAPGDLGGLPEWIQVPINNDREMIRIELLGRLSLCLDSSSRTCAWHWRTEGGEDLKIRQQPSLTRPLDDRNVRVLLGQALVNQRAVSPYEAKATPQQCAALMTRWLQDDEQFRQWEVKWMGALYETLGHLMELAVQSSMTDPKMMSTLHLQKVWRNRVAFEDVERNAPAMLPVLAVWLLAGHRLRYREAPLQTLKQAISELPECGPATWRWLQRWGLRAFLPLIPEVAIDDSGKSIWFALSCFLELWSSAGLPPPLPTTLARQWGRNLFCPSELLICCPERVAILAHSLHAERNIQLAEHEIEEILECLSMIRSRLPPLDKNQKRAGWAWLRQDLQRFSMPIPWVVPAETVTWPSFTDAMVVAGVRFVPLLTVDEIAEEGRRLEHCMITQPHCFAESKDCHFSLRCPETDKSLATCTILFADGALRLINFAGPENTHPPRMLFSAVKAFCSELVQLGQKQARSVDAGSD